MMMQILYRSGESGKLAMLLAMWVSAAAFAATDMPQGPEGDAIRLGKALATDTRRQLPAHVGNGLNCSNCHLDAGTRPGASPWTGLISAFPEYRARSGRLISLQERINDCFERSMNGKALAWDSAEMNAFLAYIRWLSSGQEAGKAIPGRGFVKFDMQLKPDPARGQQIYAGRCAQCHGEQGQGLQDGKGVYAVPPLWGKDSFNVGAGMAPLYGCGICVEEHAARPGGQPHAARRARRGRVFHAPAKTGLRKARKRLAEFCEAC